MIKKQLAAYLEKQLNKRDQDHASGALHTLKNAAVKMGLCCFYLSEKNIGSRYIVRICE